MVQRLIQHANKAKFLLNENSTTILTALGVGGTISTAVLTGNASFKAAEIIRREEEKLEYELTHSDEIVGHGSSSNNNGMKISLTKMDQVKLVWRQFLPAVASGVLTIASIITANKISSKKIAALAVAGGISERALQEYKEKVVEKFGVTKSDAVRDEIAQDRVHNNPPDTRQVLVTGTGEVLCYDMLTGRYFTSTMEDIKRAENKVNYELNQFMSCSLSNFYEEVGLEPTTYTDSVGWNMQNMMEVKFSTVMSADNRPCLAIDFSRPPIVDYDKHWD
jgi:Family of unknown function (DUF6353)